MLIMRSKGRRVLAALALAMVILVVSVSGTDYSGQIYGPFFAGTKVWGGNGTPGSFGLEGDYYIDFLTGNLYNLTSGTWTYRFSMAGITGSPGPA